MKVKTERECEYKECRKVFKKYRTTDKYCSGKCEIADKGESRLKPKKTVKIKKLSDKKMKQNLQYLADRVIFLGKPENRVCPVTGKHTTEIHHVRKRRGYADEYARLNNIPLLLDQRFWLAVSREGHQKIEDNPEWAYEMGYSIRNNSL